MALARQASGALRKAAEDVLRRAGRPAGDMSALTSRLNETMVHPGLLAELQAGRLGTAAVDALDPFSGVLVALVDLGRSARSGRAAARTAPCRRPDRPEGRGPEAASAESRARRRAGRAAGAAAELLERRRAQAAERLAHAVVDEAKGAVHDAEARRRPRRRRSSGRGRAETAARTRFERADAERSEVAARLAALDD